MAETVSHDAWHRGRVLAHTVWAAVDAARLDATPSGRDLRRAAIALPSLIGDALLNLRGDDPSAVLRLAEVRLAEVRGLLESDPVRTAVPEGDLEALLRDVRGLVDEIARLAAESAPGGAS